MIFSMPTWAILMIGVVAVVTLILVFAAVAKLVTKPDSESDRSFGIGNETETVKPTDLSPRTVGMMSPTSVSEPVSEPPVDEEASDEMTIERKKAPWRCPQCGKFVSRSAPSCPRDGTTFTEGKS